MNASEINRAGIGEYPKVLRQAQREGWLRPLMELHLTPCDRVVAKDILGGLRMPPGTSVRFPRAICCGRARRQRNGRFLITLPYKPGPESSHLRIALVLHEAAHIFSYAAKTNDHHGPVFGRHLRRLIEWYQINGSWRLPDMTHNVSSYNQIYARHRGPFTLLATRETTTAKGKVTQSSEKIGECLNAEEAHEEARVRVNAPKDNITEVYVYSDTEGQFIGAIYRRGAQFKPWRDEVESTKIAPMEEEPQLPGVPSAPAVHPQPAPPAAPPKKRAAPAAQPGDRFPVVRGRALEVDPDKQAGWPKAETVGLIRAYFEQHKRATAAEVVAALGAQLMQMGMAHPASAVSRLKQAGFLREVSE